MTTDFRRSSMLAEWPLTLLGFDMPRRNSLDSLLHSVKLLLKQTMAKEPKWKLQCKYYGLSFSCLHPQVQSMWKQLPNKKNGSQNQNQVALVSGVPQKSNTIRFRLQRPISQETAGGNSYAYMWVGNSQSCPILTTTIGLFNIVAFVYQIFASFPWTKSHTKQPRIAVG